MNKSSNVPQIRFKGFIEYLDKKQMWEITIWDKKFNEVESHKQPKVISYPYVLADVFKDIEDSNGTVKLLSTGSYIGFTTKQKAGKNLCFGEIVAIPWGGTANVKYHKGYFVTADNRIATSNNQDKLSNKYLYRWMESNIQKIQDTYRGASIQHPSMNDILSLELEIPPLKEQEKIGSLFEKLDSIISLQKEKHEQLQNIKKSLLENMFPSEGENVPKIRFKEFNKKWDKLKLKECATYRRGSFPQPYGKKEWYGGPNSKPFVQVGDVSKNFKLEEETKEQISLLAQPKSVFVPKDSVVVTLQGSIGRVAVTQYDAYFDRTILFFDTYKFAFNSYYWALIIQNKFEIERQKASGGTIKTITIEALSDFQIDVTSINEQSKIGQLFEKLDNLISVNQDKINKFENIKKSLLDKMFV